MLSARENDEVEIDLNDARTSTIFTQGILNSFANMGKYNGNRVFITTNGQALSCVGRNNLQALDVLIDPFIGAEMKDVDIKPFNSWYSYLNPVTWIASLAAENYIKSFGIQADDIDKEKIKNEGSVTFYTPVLSEMNLGQETDTDSHLQKYLLWKQTAGPSDKLILYGVSKGAATAFNAFAKYKYPEVKLLVLEGCYYSIEDLKTRWSPLKANVFSAGISLFTKYRKDGPSPAKSIVDFPQGVPVVFITSEKDKLVPCGSTEKLARELAERGLNDVFVLKLKRSRHPTYMFDDKEDHDRYEEFVNAVYKRYGLPCNAVLAERGETLVDECLICRDSNHMKVQREKMR